MLLSNPDCHTDIVRRVTEQMDAERQLRGLHEDEMVTLGIGLMLSEGVANDWLGVRAADRP